MGRVGGGGEQSWGGDEEVGVSCGAALVGGVGFSCRWAGEVGGVVIVGSRGGGGGAVGGEWFVQGAVLGIYLYTGFAILLST